LNEPVPFSIYSSQPWCAIYQYEHGCNKDCPTTDAYKPLIVVPEVVLQNMNPAWASCYGDIRGVYDPPIALTQVASMKVPQMTVPVPATIEVTSATPAPAPFHPPAETGGPRVLPGGPPSNSVGSNVVQGFPSAEPSQDLGGVGDEPVHPNDLPANNPADGIVPHASQSSGSNQDVGDIIAGIAAEAVRPNDLPASNAVAEGIVPHASQSFGSNQNVGDIIAAFLGGSTSSNDDDSSSDRLSEAGVPKEHPNAFSSGNVVGNVVPHGSQASGSIQNVEGLVASILHGAENPAEANPASASQASDNGVPAVPPGANPPSGSTAGDNKPQASWLSALDQDIGDIVASVLRDGGRLPGTGASVSRPPQEVPESEWDSLPPSTFNPESPPHEASDSIMESGKANQSPTVQPSGAVALVTSQSFPSSNDAHNSDTSLSLPSDVLSTTSDNESGVNEPKSTQGSNADSRTSANSSKSITASVSKAVVSSSGSERITCSIALILIVTSFSVL
jgi:hypothetical protein